LCLSLALAAACATTAANAAFKIVQATGGNYIPSVGPVACGQGKCKTTLKPTTVVDLGPGSPQNIGLLFTDLAFQRPAYTIGAYGGSLDLDFIITHYGAYNAPPVHGANFYVDYKAQQGAVLPDNLHWIQVVTDNFNISGVNGSDFNAPKGLGQPESIIDALNTPNQPYYDANAAANNPPFASSPPSFRDFSSRFPEPNAAHPRIDWTAELFLVSDPGTKVMTVYNGVQWGWVTQYSANGNFAAIPEPAAWGLMLAGLGLAGAGLRRGRRATATAR
jgi:hypothetical protein